MRALIRVELAGLSPDFPQRSEEEYDKNVKNLFAQMGFDARPMEPGPDGCSEEIEYLFEGVPKRIKDEEMKHIVMLGYTSEGQAKFCVCSINRETLHVRIRDDLFDKLKRACSELCARVWQLNSSLPRKGWFKRRALSVSAKVRSSIEVMEPGHGHATILGHIVQHPVRVLFRTYPGEVLIASTTLLLFCVLFWLTPDLAAPIAAFLSHFRQFSAEYVQGALERIHSALLVTSFVTFIDLFIKFREFRRVRPIMWNAGIEPSKPGTR